MRTEQTEKVEILTETLAANGQFQAAILVAARHGGTYRAPKIVGTVTDVTDPADSWLDELLAAGRRVCGQCLMALPLTGQCDNCE